jgi:hypothetical protein
LSREIYTCGHCGRVVPGVTGQCPHCHVALIGVRQVSSRLEGFDILDSLFETLFSPITFGAVVIFCLVFLRQRWRLGLLIIAAYASLYVIVQLIGDLISRLRKRG